LSNSEVLDLVLVPDHTEDRNEAIKQLRERLLSHEEAARLAEVVSKLGDLAESAGSRERGALHRTIRRLVASLPPELALTAASRHLSAPQKSGRQIAYRVLRQTGISESAAEQLRLVYEKYHDGEILELVARDERAILTWGPIDLATAMDDRYWQARVLAVLLDREHQHLEQLAFRFPIAYAHAVGRLSDESALPLLQRVLEKNWDNADFLCLYAYALGRLRCRREVEALEEALATRLAPRTTRRPT